MELEDLAAGYEAEYEVLDGPVVRGREHHGVLGGPGGRGDRGRGDHQDCESWTWTDLNHQHQLRGLMPMPHSFYEA